MLKKQLYIFLMLISFSFCDDANVPVEPPSYVKINNVKVLTDEIIEGSNKHQIDDVWLSVNSTNYGTIPLSNNIPLVENGENWLLVRAGIKNNNQSNNRIDYPFLKLDSILVDLIPGDTIEVVPEFKYVENLSFPLISNFDNSNDFELFLGDGIMQTSNNPDEVFEGDKSLKISLNEDNKEFGLLSIQEFELPIGNVPVYWEMHYKCESFFSINILAFLETSPYPVEERVLTIGASDTWKKIYIPLTFFASSFNADSYKISIRGNLSSEVQEATYLFDNFKLIHQ